MKKTNSLRVRIVFAFTAFAFILGVLFTVFIIGSMHFAQDVIVRQQLEEGRDFWMQRHGDTTEPRLPNLPFLKGYAGMAELPTERHALVDDLEPGIHRIPCDDTVPERNTWVSIFDHRGTRYYFFYYVTNYLGQNADSVLLFEFMLAGILVLTLAGFGLGMLTARSVVRPVIDLARLVERTEPKDLPEQLARGELFYHDEVGFLAARLARALQDVEAYHEREQRFTRYASHELRTPVAIVKNAAELLALQPGLKESRPLGRIERSVTDMERLIETFLTLARQETITAERPTNVVEVVHDAVERQREQLGARELELRMEAEGDVRVPVPDTIVRVLVDNLLVNAIRHSGAGAVSVRVDAGSISVVDSGPGIPEDTLTTVRGEYVRGKDSTGYGLGLAIVEDLCRRYNWRFELKNRDTRGLVARLDFAAALSPT